MTASNGIRPIDKASVHRICSGQVILDLATVVKELVENALDAGASSVEVRLREYGSELIEVADNGHGVPSRDYEALMRKYHTSKIANFEDLASLKSFGFRGEALSSLCALADVGVVTRAAEDECGTKLNYDHHGNLVSRATSPRAIGTTISVSGLFRNLPVRYKEFHRKIKGEYSRLVTLLHGYALISTNVRMVCTNQTASGARTVILATQGGGNMRENVSTLFGRKTLEALQEIEIEDENNFTGKISGFVSKSSTGKGKSAADRQFFFINGRPVDFPKGVKVLNETWRAKFSALSSVSRPTAILNIQLPTDAYDINITPDKRKFMAQQENILLSVLQNKLSEIWESSRSKLVVHDALMSSQLAFEAQPASRTDVGEDFANSTQRRGSANDNGSDDTNDLRSKSIRNSCGSMPNGLNNEDLLDVHGDILVDSDDALDENEDLNEGRQLDERYNDEDKVTEGENTARNTSAPPDASNDEGYASMEETMTEIEEGIGGDSIEAPPSKRRALLPLATFIMTSARKSQVSHSNGVVSTEDRDPQDVSKSRSKDILQKSLFSFGFQRERNLSGPGPEETGQQQHLGRYQVQASSKDANEQATAEDYVDDGNEQTVPLDTQVVGSYKQNRSLILHEALVEARSEHTNEEDGVHEPSLKRESNIKSNMRIDHFSLPKLCTSMESIRSRTLKRARKQMQGSQRDSHDMACGNKYHLASITGNSDMKENRLREPDASEDAVDAECNGRAMKELEHHFNKSDFRKLRIVGQFNLGFIIAQLGKDLFIIDQHASDERANFERLQATTVLNRQPLLVPQPLGLSPIEELIVRDNLEAFRRCGFDFKESNDTGKLSLSAVPFSKGITFGVEDVVEMVGMLQSGEGHHEGFVWRQVNENGEAELVLFPTRVRSMFASRACRSSVMIGKALRRSAMKRLVENLADLRSPWICAHGRPTMRHLALLR